MPWAGSRASAVVRPAMSATTVGLVLILGGTGCTTPAVAPAVTQSDVATTGPQTADPVVTDDGGPSISAPTAIAPSTSGDLDADVFPTMSGWTPVPGEGDEGRYIPNGTWVHEVDADNQSLELMLQRCDSAPANYPKATWALAATWENSAGDPATGLALKFASVGQATTFLSGYSQGVLSCASGTTQGMFTASRITDPDAPLVDRRHFTDGNGDWVEVVHQDRSILRLTMFSEARRDLDRAAIRTLVRETKP